VNSGRRTWLIAALAAAALVSCSDSTAPRVRFSEVAGTYDLVMVGQAPLPYSQTYHPGGTLSISAGSLVLGSDGRFTQSQHQNGATASWGGTYSVTDSTVVLHMAGSADSSVLRRDDPALVTTWETFVMHGRVSKDYSYAMYGLALYATHQIPYCTSYNVCIADARLYLWANGKFTATTAPPTNGSLPADIVALSGSGTYTINNDTLTLSSGTARVIGLKVGSGIRFDSLTYILAFDPATAASDTLRFMAPAEGSRYTYAGAGSVVIGVKALLTGADGAVMDVNGGLDQSMAASCSTEGGDCTDTYFGLVTLAKGLIQGLNTIVVKAYKGPTLVSSGTVHVTMWETPQVEVSAPDTSVAFATDSGSVEIIGTATHSQRVARLTWQVNGGAEHDVSVTPGARVSFDAGVSLPPGVDRVAIRAYNDSGIASPYIVRVLRSLPASTAGSWRTISVAAYNACGLTVSGAAYCWGAYYAPTPTAAGGPAFSTISARNNYGACALDSAGAAYCWGGYGESPTPVPVPGGLTFATLHGSCGVTKDGAAYCVSPTAQPVRIGASQTWADVVSGSGHCGLTTAGKVFCWGGYPYPDTLVAAMPQLTFRAISMSSSRACGIATDDNTYCWGNSAWYGMVAGGLSLVSTTDGYCGLTAAGSGYCDLSGGKAPTPTPGTLAWVNLSASAPAVTCGVTANGAAYCWGNGNYGRLGNGSAWDFSAPVRVIDP